MAFIHDNFLLQSSSSQQLYHAHAENLPIIDYHCHLSPKQIAENIQFEDITQLWLVDKGAGDHYKWRAMRAHGVSEDYITFGKHNSWDIFQKWAGTVPYTMRNPLYHWTHLELSRVFGIEKTLNPGTAAEIFEECNAKLATDEYRGQALIRRFGVEVVCTTDDPVDDLRYHKQIAQNPFGTKVLPTWRPDKAMAIENTKAYIQYIKQLSEVSGIEVNSYQTLIEALQLRHDYFESCGCRLSDHGMDTFYSSDYTEGQVDAILKSVLEAKRVSDEDIVIFRSAILYDLAIMDAKSGWTQQFHIGPLRNNNTHMFSLVGPDTGYDAIGDKPVAESCAKFFDRLASEDKLAKTILYCLNPKDNEVLAAMAYCFNDGITAGKMQFGSAWWFLDQEFGMRKQIDCLSAFGLLSHFVGMLTDSRSFISYPRHEYFRRILCDIIGSDIESGRLPSSEMPRIAQMIEDISYYNAKNYFQF